MSIKTIQRTIITITRDEIKRRLISAFQDIFNDYNLMDRDDRGCYEADFNRLTDELDSIDNGNVSSVFEEGYTMMVLTDDEFELVDSYLSGDRSGELVIRIADNNSDLFQDINLDLVKY